MKLVYHVVKLCKCEKLEEKKKHSVMLKMLADISTTNATPQMTQKSHPVFCPLVDGCTMWNQSAPIIVSLRHKSSGNDPVAAHWSLHDLKHNGSWSTDGCQLAHSDASISTLRCTVLSNYAVLQVGNAKSTVRYYCLIV